MGLRRQAIATAVVLAGALPVTAQGDDQHRHDRRIEFPETADGVKILTVDLHTHSVFSDGQVWPSIRVEEAVRDGVDVLAITEHLEYQRHRLDIPNPDRNRAFLVAKNEAAMRGLSDVIIVNGSEITRDNPPGHVNAVFIDDANPLLVTDAEAAIRAANDQGAFVFWNHPHWLPQAHDGIARTTEMHDRLIDEGLLHGVEVVNGTLDGYSEHALAIALEHEITILGTSDIHGLVDWTHDAGHGGHRPMTLVLAPDTSEDAVKQALFDGKTVAFNYDDLIGREEHVSTVVNACLSLQAGGYAGHFTVLPVRLVNRCPVNFNLRNTTANKTFQNYSDVIQAPANSAVMLQVRMGETPQDLTLKFEVLNTQIRPREHLTISLSDEVTSTPKPKPDGDD